MPTCKICHQRQARDGMSVCSICLGLEQPELHQEEHSMDNSIATSMDQIQQASIEPEADAEPFTAICTTCGEVIEPYQLGRNTIKAGICSPCLMKKKYGNSWVPGKNPQKRKASAKAYREAKKVEKDADQGNGKGKSLTRPVNETPPEWPSITLHFEGEDRALFGILQEIARKERRTIDQQVLWFIDKTLDLPRHKETTT